MPVEYRYDPDRPALTARASGVLRIGDFDLANFPEVDAGTPQLFDARGVDAVELTSADVRRLAAAEAAAGTHRISRLAFVTGTEVAFGLARMFQIFAREASYDIEVFRDEAEAWRWLETGER